MARSRRTLSREVDLELPPLWMNPYADADQFRAITCPDRMSIMATGTKIGKTVGMAEWIIERGFEHDSRRHLWLAPIYKQTRIGFNRVKAFLLKSDYLQRHCHVNESQLFLGLPNDAELHFRSAKDPNAIFGEEWHSGVGDEAPRFPVASWEAMLSTMTVTRGPIRLAGNCDRGKANWFYKLYLDGLAGKPGLRSWSVKTTESPFVTRETIEEYRERLSAVMFAALIEAIFPENALTVFVSLDKVLDHHPQVCPTCKIRQTGSDIEAVIQPPRNDRSYLAGMDLGRYRNFSAIHVLDAETGETVYWRRFNRVSWEVTKQRMRDVMNAYPNTSFLIDSTKSSVGDEVLESMQRDGLPVFGYDLGTTTKQPLIERLVVGVERGQFSFPTCLKLLRAEMEAFEYELTSHGHVLYHAPKMQDEQLEELGEENHDDTVIACALAFWFKLYRGTFLYKSGEQRRFTADSLKGMGITGKGRTRTRGF